MYGPFTDPSGTLSELIDEWGYLLPYLIMALFAIAMIIYGLHGSSRADTRAYFNKPPTRGDLMFYLFLSSIWFKR